MTRGFIVRALREFAEAHDLLDCLSPNQPLTEQLLDRDIVLVLKRAHELRKIEERQ